MPELCSGKTYLLRELAKEDSFREVANLKALLNMPATARVLSTYSALQMSGRVSETTVRFS